MSRRIVPFRRPLKLGARGQDVRAVKRALARWRNSRGGHRKLLAVTPILGPFAVRDLKAFQRPHGILATGRYGPPTHRALLPWMDDYAVWLYTGGKTPGDLARDRVVAAALALYAEKDRVRYTQDARRMTIVRERLRPPFRPGAIYEDCSSSVTGLYWLAGAPDPNGRGYDGQGWTGTLGQHGRPVTYAQARPGDLVFYGQEPPWQHVALYLGGGRVWSHGSDGGPYLLPVDYRADIGQVRSYL